MSSRAYILSFFASVFVFMSCEKEETPIKLPPPGSSLQSTITMGEDYENQVFFNLQTGSVVMTSKVNSWDFAFETAAEGFHIFMNGGKGIFMYNTHETDAAQVMDNYQYTIPDSAWLFDASCGLPDSTGVGNWRNTTGLSKNEVYVVKLNSTTFKKIILRSVDNSKYVLDYGELGDNSLQSVTIPKDAQYNYSYFSFDNGGTVVYPDPPKSQWDIVFTRYRYIYYDLDNFPYFVSGVLLNPYNTSALPDSSNTFKDIQYNSNSSIFSNHRDIIGFDWKSYNFTTGMYDVKPGKNYIINTQSNAQWKLHFLNFYSNTGIKGSPSFEYEQLH